MSGRTSSADDADHRHALCEGDQEEAAPGRVAHNDFSALPLGMVRVVVDPRQRISEHGEGLLERDAMLPEVRGGLRWVPRKPRGHHRQAYHPPPAALPKSG